jgi:hypothetical protein
MTAILHGRLLNTILKGDNTSTCTHPKNFCLWESRLFTSGFPFSYRYLWEQSRVIRSGMPCQKIYMFYTHVEVLWWWNRNEKQKYNTDINICTNKPGPFIHETEHARYMQSSTVSVRKNWLHMQNSSKQNKTRFY